MIHVAVLGATGSVGRKFLQLLENHPWFDVKAVAASDRSVGKKLYSHTLVPCRPDLPVFLVFSALNADVAGEIETGFANAGYTVISNARNHRMDPGVPLVIPEVNGDHLSDSKIITNPNCSTIGLCMALKPLHDHFGVEEVSVTTCQAISGAGELGAKGLNITDNVIPFISGEEEKMEQEPLKILSAPDLKISAQCNRVPVTDGHILSVSVKLKSCPTKEEMIAAWNSFEGNPELPNSPKKPIHYFSEESFPQPKLHRDLEGGMAISIGRLRPCNLFDYKFTVLVHNTVRGGAGNAILIAEHLYFHHRERRVHREEKEKSRVIGGLA